MSRRKISANVGRSRQNGQLCEHRSQTSTAKSGQGLNQGTDHLHPRPIIFYHIHVGYLLRHPGITTLYAVVAKATMKGFSTKTGIIVSAHRWINITLLDPGTSYTLALRGVADLYR